MRCPQCNREFDPEKSEAMPFCCERCRMIDLGAWLNEERSVPEDIEAEQPPDEDDGNIQ